MGTMLLTLTICSGVSSAILSEAQVGIWQVTVLMWLGVALAIYTTSHICDAHLNPAITIAFAVIRRKSFSWKKIVPYIISQMLGGVFAGAVLYFFAYEQIAIYEERNGIERGRNGSVITASMFGEYFPNPSLFDHGNQDSFRAVSLFKAFAVEAWATSILAFIIFSLTDEVNLVINSKDSKIIVPLLIGAAIALLLSLYGPYTQAGMNPARDFGPRLIASFAGWGTVAIPGPRKGFWVYIMGPIVGALSGAALNDLIVSKLSRTIRKWKDSEVDGNNKQILDGYSKMTRN